MNGTWSNSRCIFTNKLENRFQIIFLFLNINYSTAIPSISSAMFIKENHINKTLGVDFDCRYTLARIHAKGGSIMTQETILITGAGTGFGKGFAFGLAEQGKNVIAGVEAMSQVSSLEKEAKERGLTMQIEKLDVTNPQDRQKAWHWDIDILVNNAAVKEGGSLVDIPEENLRRQFDVNTIGPILLTQEFARRMAKNRKGRIIFVSSQSGLKVSPFSGPYCGSKFAIEAFAATLSQELQEFSVEVATINPGPFLTGFNEREFEAWKNWPTDPEDRIFDYTKLAYPNEQYDPEILIEAGIKVILGETKQYRNVVPEEMVPEIKEQMEHLWKKQTDENLGQRHETVQKAYDIEPATPVEKE